MPAEMRSAVNYDGGVDGAESIQLLFEELLRDDGTETVDLAAILGQLVGHAVIARCERPEDGIMAQAVVWMVGEAAVEFHDRFVRLVEAT